MGLFYTFDPSIGFYNSLYNEIPKNAKPITQEKFDELFLGQSKGKRIITDSKGNLSLESPIAALATKPVINRKLTSLEFLAVFTVEEKDQIMQFARGNNQAMLWLITATGATYVDLDDPITIQGLGFLVTIGVINNERLNEIKNYGLS